MDDFKQLEKTVVRELSCRMCLCTDVMLLTPLSTELKRKIKRLFGVEIRSDDTLPKAICHDCLQHVSMQHLYAVKVEKIQNFLKFHKGKIDEKSSSKTTGSISSPLTQIAQGLLDADKSQQKTKSPPTELPNQQGDSKIFKIPKEKLALEKKFMESMPLEEFALAEKVDQSLLSTTKRKKSPDKHKSNKKNSNMDVDYTRNNDVLDSVVIIDGRPAKQGAALDKQITLFYKMECCICHQNGFHYRSLIKHYKERHGVPGYVECCEKKFHYFSPKKIIEHMAYHLQPNIFMCNSCHTNFQSSQDLADHQTNGGRSGGKILCPRCQDRYPTYRELGTHIVSHRDTALWQCDYCGKLLKHHHRKKTVNHMQDVILCSQCIRSLRNIEKQEKKNKKKNLPIEKSQMKKYQKFSQALGLSGDEDISTD